MSLHTGKVLGISITTNSKKEILEYINKYLENPAKKRQKSLVIVTPNPEQLILAQTDTRFAKILNQADIAIPDGIGVAVAAGVVRIPGVEFMEEVAQVAAKRHVPIRLIGGFGDVAVKAFECLQKKHPSLETTKNPRIVFVGLGAPKQEFYISEVSKKTNGVIFMAVGGSFDIIAGEIPRAPLFMRVLGFEWLWRLGQEPKRWKRQLALLKFMWLVLRERLSGRPK